jgi:hypothetical protein
MVLNTRSPRTGEAISNGQFSPAWTSRLQAELGAPEEFLAIGRSSLAAEIDANSLRVSIGELEGIIHIAESQGVTEVLRYSIRRRDELQAELDAMIRDGVPKSSTSGIYDVRIRWMEWTGKRPEMEDAIVQYTALKADDATCDAIHDGNAGEGPGAEFRQLRITDYNTFCRKMTEYGYAVERLDAPSESPRQDNPFTVRPPV